MVQDAVLRQLHDDDLTVVKAALSIDGLSDIIKASDLFEALHDALTRCVTFLKGASHGTSVAIGTALLCLEHATSILQNNNEFSSRIASMIFPFLLLLLKTRKLNLKALHLAKASNWPFYQNISVNLSTLQDRNCSSINMDIIKCLGEEFLAQPKESIPWIVQSCNDFEFSKTTFLLIMLQSLITKHESSQFLTLFETCMPFLKTEWEAFESTALTSFKEIKVEMDCNQLLDRLSDTDLKELNGNIMCYIFWRLTEAFVVSMPTVLLDNDVEWSNRFRELFVFLASSKSKLLFRQNLCYLVSRCKTTPVHLLTSFFTNEAVHVSVQVESLHCLAYLCTVQEAGLHSQLLSEFPSILVPLSNDNQDIRLAAMECIDRLSYLSNRVDFSGTNTNWKNFLTEVLSFIVQQKGLILSDRNFLLSLLTSIMGPPSENFLIPQTVGPRFNQETKDDMLSYILGCALRLSPHGKFKILSLLKGTKNAVLHVKGVESLLSDLLTRRVEHHLKFNRSFQKLSEIEINILCLLLESCAVPASGCGHYETLLEALDIGATSSDDSATIQPSISVLTKLCTPLYESMGSEMQERLFLNLIHIYRSGNHSVQSAAREAILRLNIKYSSAALMLNCIIHLKSGSADVQHGKTKKKKDTHYQLMNAFRSSIGTGDKALSFVSSLFDIILLKKDMESRELLLGPIFLLLREIFSMEWVVEVADPDAKWIDASSGIFQSSSSSLTYIQQTLLLIIEEIIAALTTPVKDDILNMIDVELLVKVAHSVTDTVTCNHIFSVLSSITRVSPDKVLQHMLMIMKAIGESTVTQVDKYSQHVFEGLISAIVPCWLAKGNDCDHLLEIFVNILPEVTEHRRLPVIINILRVLGESHSLASLLILLIRSLIARKGTKSVDTFVSEALDQYMVMELALVLKFCFKKVQDPEIGFKLESGEDADHIQKTLGELMEQVVSLSLFYSSIKTKTGAMSVLGKELKENTRALLKIIMRAMIPSTYFNTIFKLLGHADGNVRKKALLVLCETMKDQNMAKASGRRNSKTETVSLWLHADESTRQSFDMLCLQIIQLVDNDNDSSSSSLKMAAVSAIEVLATRSPLNQSIFGKCLTSISKSIDSIDMHVASCCLRAAAALINQLGPRALPELPFIMDNILKRFRDLSACLPLGSKDIDSCPSLGSLNLSESFMVAVLDFLAVAIDKLGGFLNPYLVDIIQLLVLYPDCVSTTHPKLRSRADVVRKLFAERINKLTETMFKPLFFRSIEWAQLDVGQSATSESDNNERAISFFALVSRLSKDLGSPFVPYFKYLLGSCLRYLGGSANDPIKRKRKKVQVHDAMGDDKSKFLDKANFDALLEPLVLQLDVDPPMSLEEHPEVPSVEQVDSLLVMCVGQMAASAGTDTLWKELNNRVLMQTRSDKIRARILGLRIVKNLTDNLKEEYLVLLAETIPFLGELLEDVEVPVKTLAKEHIIFGFSTASSTTPSDTVVGLNAINRRFWIRAMMEDVNKNGVLAVQTLRNNIMASTLLASTAIMLSSLIAILMTSNATGDKMSIRYYNHASILINVPYKQMSPILRHHHLTAEYVSKTINRGSYFWSLGLRAFYFSFPLFLWIFGPIPMFVCCLVMVFALYFLDVTFDFGWAGEAYVDVDTESKDEELALSRNSAHTCE
ncbi:unnamed protein product [Rhodiola kirilowii]